MIIIISLNFFDKFAYILETTNNIITNSEAQTLGKRNRLFPYTFF